MNLMKTYWYAEKHDCDKTSHWNDNSSLWLNLSKGIKIDHCMWGEQIDVMKIDQVNENSSK